MKTIRTISVSLLLAFTSFTYAESKYVPLHIEYDDFKNITAEEFEYGNSIIKKGLKGFDNSLYNIAMKTNEDLYNKTNQNQTNNSFTLAAHNTDNDNKATVSFIRNYKNDYGGCILILDYDDCESLEGDIYESINELFKIKSSSNDIYKFFAEHERSHTLDGFTYIDDIIILKTFQVFGDDFDVLKRHYLEVHADISAVLNLKASDELIDDITKMRDLSYFTTDDIVHYTSLYIQKLKGFDYSNHNPLDNHIVVNSIFKSTFSVDILTHNDSRVSHLFHKINKASKILSKSNYNKANYISSYIKLKESHSDILR